MSTPAIQLSSRLPKNLHRLTALVLISASVAVIVLFMLLGQYAIPVADDYCMAAGVRDQGFLPHLWHHYFEWSGRFTSNSLYAAFPLLAGLYETYPYLAFVLIFALALSFAFFLSQWLRTEFFTVSVWLLTLVFITVYLLGLRHTASSLYWMAGAFTYQTPVILSLVILGLVLRIRTVMQQGIAPHLSHILLTLSLVLAIGCNELSMLLVSGLVMLLSIVKIRPFGFRGYGLLMIVASLAAFAVVYLAPGNEVRQSTFPAQHDFYTSLQGTWKMGLWSLLVWTGNPVFMAGSVLVLYAAFKLAKDQTSVEKVDGRLIGLMLLVTLTVPFVFLFPSWWALGGWPPPRVIDGLLFFFLLCWFVFLMLISQRLYPLIAKLFGSGWTGMVVTALFISSLGISSKLAQAYGDYRETGAVYQAYMLQRLQLIGEAKAQGIDVLTLPGFQGEFPKSLYFNDIRTDWRDWRNRCYADYTDMRALARER